MCRLLPAIPAGRASRWSVRWLVAETRIGYVEAAGRTLSGTVFWPMWLRLAGMRVGRGCEISTISGVLPELVELEGDCFFADGVYLGTPRYRAGVVEYGPVRLGRDSFVGNHSVLPPGTDLGGDVLLGVCTVADATMSPGTSWFGLPAFALPRREVIAADRSLTHDPSLARVASRWFWELLRFALPLWPLAAWLLWFKLLPTVQAAVPAAVFVLLVPVWVAAGLLLSLGWVWALKWTLLGRVKPGQHPLWSCWCSRWDFVYVAWQRWAAPIARVLEGGLLIVPWLRAMGVRVGRDAYLGGGFSQVVDPDMIEIGDGATVACAFQAHTFEDRVLKVAPVRIGAGATVAAGGVVMYGARIQPGAHVGHHSVVMKDEVVEGRVEGAPVAPAQPR